MKRFTTFILFSLTTCVIIPLPAAAEEQSAEARESTSERSVWRPWTWFRAADQRGQAGEQRGPGSDRTDRADARRDSADPGRDIAREKSRGFSEADRKRIAEIPDSALPPGLAKRQESGRGLPRGLQKRQEQGKGLPPGWLKKVESGKPLPEDIHEKASPVPDSLRPHLPEAPEGTVDLLIEEQLIRVAERTREVIDRIKIGRDD